MIPCKAPNLLLRTVGENHAYAVNCSYPNSFRVLNKTQYEILSAINGQDDVSTIATKLSMPHQLLQKFLQLLNKTKLVSFDTNFSEPQKQANPESLNFWIHTTNVCNLGCSYCYISTLNTGKGMALDVQRQLIVKLTDTAIKRKLRTIKLRLAGGEPMAHFNSWKEFISESIPQLASVGCKLEISFITNLTILNDDIIQFAKEYNISFGVSLDGLGEVHDATRKFKSGAGSFDVVDKNLQALLTNSIAVSVNTVLTNNNIFDLPNLTRYLVSLNIPFRYSIVKGEAIHPAMLEDNLSESYIIMENAITKGWQFSKHYRFCDLKPNELGFQTCASGHSGGAIYTDGTLKYCQVHVGTESHPTATIFNHELDLLDLIERGEHFEDVKSEDCSKCRYRSICTSGCPIYREQGKDPQCSLYHRFIPKYFELQALERLHLLNKCDSI